MLRSRFVPTVAESVPQGNSTQLEQHPLHPQLLARAASHMKEIRSFLHKEDRNRASVVPGGRGRPARVMLGGQELRKVRPTQPSRPARHRPQSTQPKRPNGKRRR